jgi:hypothetical protein
MNALFLMLIAFASSSALAQSAPATGVVGTRVSLMAMALTSSTKQGGNGPQGSTFLTHSEVQYNWNLVGLGLYFQYDRHGEAETDTGFGPKIEFDFEPFYLEIGYTLKVTRAYTDRSIAQQTGTGTLFGVGVRFSLAGQGTPGGGGLFFQASYKYRSQTLKQQDGVDLSEPIEQTDGYPVLGIGYKF